RAAGNSADTGRTGCAHPRACANSGPTRPRGDVDPWQDRPSLGRTASIWRCRRRRATSVPSGSEIRPAAAAGSFYPGDARRLDAEVGRLLAQVPVSAAAAPKALIAPHAGYVYSGAVAAAAFAALRDRRDEIARVVVIGPAHYVPMRGIAFSTAEAFATPLGRIPVDRDALAAVADLPFVNATDAAHLPEHAIEVELPFLQHLLPHFALVPLLVGDATPEEVAEILARVWGGAET